MVHSKRVKTLNTGGDPSTPQASEKRLIHHGGSDLVERLDEITARSDLFIPYCAGLIFLFLLIPLASHMSGGGLSTGEMLAAALLILVALGGSIPVRRWSEERRTLHINYDLTRADIVQRLACAGTVGAALGAVERLWKMSARTTATDDAKEVLQPRLAARCVKASPANLMLNVESWCVVAGPIRVFFLPDCVLIEQDHHLTAITYDQITVEAGTIRYTEWDAPARDTHVLEEQWRFVKEGGDRVDEVRHINICEFGELFLGHKDRWQIVLQASDARAVHQAARALKELVLAAQVENGTASPTPTPAPPSGTLLTSTTSRPTTDGSKDKQDASAPKPLARPCPKCEHMNAETDRFCSMCGAGMADLATGAVVHGRYVVLRGMARGAVGMLYRVWDTQQERSWTLKEMAVEGKSGKEKKDAAVRFGAEGQMLRAVVHPALPTIRDHFTENGAHYFVMGLVNGDGLLEILESEGKPGLAEEVVLRIGDEILDALEYLHAQRPPILFGVLHPGLVLRQRRTRASDAALPAVSAPILLTDFGVARTVSAATISKAIEHPAYAAPETYHGGVDARSDLYAVGAILHHLLTGKAPEEGVSFENVRTLAPDVSERTEQVLKRALYLEPGQRYESAAQMRAALRGMPLEPEGPRPPREMTVRAEAKHAVVTQGMCHSVSFTPDGDKLMTGCYDIKLWDVETRMELRKAQVGRGASSCAAISPDGTLLAFGGLDGAVHLQPTKAGGVPRTMTGHVDQVSSLAFSPTMPLLASASLDGTLRLWDVVEAASTHTLAAVGHVPRAVAFSPTGTRLASAFTNLIVWDAIDGSLVHHVPPEALAGVSIRALAYSPDGKFLACACSDSTVKLLDAHTFQVVRRLEGHDNQVLTVAWAPIGWLLASGGSDARVCLWDAEVGDEVGRLEGHTSAVSTIAWSADGRLLATGSWDLTARLWSVHYDRGGQRIPVTRQMPKAGSEI